MSLPWFPFYADAYTGDTGHLTCEEHGAYLQLMLAYYRSEKPLPGTDRALAALVKLPMDRWLECKPALAPFFRSEGGIWHHDRIDEEIKNSHDKHARAVVRASTAATARHSRAKDKTATSKPQADQTDAHLHLQLHPPSGGVEPPPPKFESDGVGSPINPAFRPAEKTWIDAIGAGFSMDDFEAEIRKFVATKRSDGAFSSDWDASFVLWLEREKAFRAKTAKPPRAAPRVEVNALPDWDGAITRWIKNQSHWSYKNFGPEPGQSGCRAPVELLEKYGIDPATGIIKEQA